MIYLFGFTFSLAFTPFQALYPVECLNFENRAKGMAVYNFWVNVASFFNQYVTPIGLGDAGWKFYFLYIAWDTFQAAFIYLFYVETRDRTLEVSPPVSFGFYRNTGLTNENRNWTRSSRRRSPRARRSRRPKWRWPATRVSQTCWKSSRGRLARSFVRSPFLRFSYILYCFLL